MFGAGRPCSTSSLVTEASISWSSPAFVDTSHGAIIRLDVDMTKRKRREFTPKFKADAVKLVRAGGRSIVQTARDLDLAETALRGWIRQAEIEAGEGPPGALSQAEREELVRLRRYNKRLKMERDILKSDGPLREGERVRFLFIRTEKANDPLTVLCRVLKVSRSGYYAFEKRGPSARENSDGECQGKLRDVLNFC